MMTSDPLQNLEESQKRAAAGRHLKTRIKMIAKSIDDSGLNTATEPVDMICHSRDRSVGRLRAIPSWQDGISRISISRVDAYAMDDIESESSGTR